VLACPRVQKPLSRIFRRNEGNPLVAFRISLLGQSLFVATPLWG
jgi:hypothetical protein